MPATAGRVRMPANNRVHSSAALQTHGIWQSAIGYDPYAPTNKEERAQPNVPNAEPDGENAYASFQGLMALARITQASTVDEARGACKRCCRVGHLTYQCRNFLSVKDDKEKDPEAMQADIAAELGKLKGKLGKGKNVVDSDSEEEDEEDESSDSDYNSEFERIIAQRMGKKVVQKEKLKKKDKDSDDDGLDTDSGEKRKKRGRSKKRRSSKRKHDESDDSEEERKKRRKKKRRRRDESSDEDGKRCRRHRKSGKEKRRRHHRYSDDSESDASEDAHRRHRSRRSRRAATPSDSYASGSDDSRVGRGRKRSEKKSHKHHRDAE